MCSPHGCGSGCHHQMALLHTHRSSHPAGAVGWDALLGEPANSKRLAVPFLSLRTLMSCDRELPGERAVVLEGFLHTSCDRFSLKVVV